MYDFKNVIIGAGVIGLAIARELALKGEEVIVLDKEPSFGFGNSSRNSEVVHAGIYYRPNSLKARHCVLGRKLLYEYCESRNIEHDRVGKLIVATEESELELLYNMQEHSTENGLVKSDRLNFLSKTHVSAIAPELSCVAALHSPETGIVNSHQFMQNLELDAQKFGTTFSYGTSVRNIEYKNSLMVAGESVNEYFKIEAKNVILAAGIHTEAISMEARLPTPSGYWLKGNYFRLRGKSPFNQLIYPVPSFGGLGIHLTIDLDGFTKFGPDTQLVCDEDYRVDPSRLDDFERSIRKYWPTLPADCLYPDYAGIRPKLYSDPTIEPDFIIYSPAQTGVEGLYVLHGIESPGLTASLSLAREIYNLIEKAT